MKKPSRFLALKIQRDASLARSWIIDEFALHVRGVSSARLTAVLRTEQFDVVLADHRGAAEDLIATLEDIRRAQPHARLLVVSDAIGLTEVRQAMRFNVQDIFLPPFSFEAVVTRLERELTEIGSALPEREKSGAARWSELADVLNGTLATKSDANPSAAATATGDAGLRRALEEQTAAVARQRAELEAARARIAELEAGSAQHAAAAPVDQGHLLDAAAQRQAVAEAALAEARVGREAVERELKQACERLREAEAELAAARSRPAPASSAGEAGHDEFLQARDALEKQREAVMLQEQALRELAQMLDEREAGLSERAAQVESLADAIDADLAGLAKDAEALGALSRQIEQRRQVIGERLEQARGSVGVS